MRANSSQWRNACWLRRFRIFSQRQRTSATNHRARIIARDGVVIQMSFEHLTYPRAGPGDGVVHSSAQLHLDRLQLSHQLPQLRIKFSTHHCALITAPHILSYWQAAACPRVAKKTVTCRNLRSLQVAAQVPSAGTITLQIELRSTECGPHLPWSLRVRRAGATSSDYHLARACAKKLVQVKIAAQ